MKKRLKMPELKVGVIGLGVGQAHVKSYQDHPDCKVTMIADLETEKLKEYKEQGIECTTDANSLIVSDEVDLVSIASYDDIHGQQILLALKNGKHVFVEKPLCFDEKEANQIFALLKEKPELKLTSNLVLRRSPRFIQVKEMLEAGKLGKSYYFEADYNFGRLHKIVDGWRGQLPFYSVMLGGGVHMVDLVLWLAKSKVIEVTAMGNNICTEDTGFKFNDLTVGLLKFEDGQLAKVSSNYGCVRSHFHNFLVYGTEGTFINDDLVGKFISSRDPEVAPTLLDSAYPGVEKGVLIHNFVDHVLGKTEVFVSQQEIFDVMSVCFALDESAQKGVPVKVRYP
jgi:predicted dehydrogenase